MWVSLEKELIFVNITKEVLISLNIMQEDFVGRVTNYKIPINKKITTTVRIRPKKKWEVYSASER